MMTRLQKKYKEEIIPKLMKELNLNNVMECPKVKKVTINMGLSGVREDPKILESAIQDLSAISGQKPQITKAKKSIAAFKIRKGWIVGLKVTLRGKRMFEFLDKFINLAIPRIRDFRGLSSKSFDGRGNYTIGIKEQIIFPEIEYEKVYKVRGMDICITTSAKGDKEALSLFKALGMPFRKD